MTDEEAKAFLRRGRLGVMALANGGAAYALPLFYAYDGYALFFHSRHGEKDAFLETTDDACFVVVEQSSIDDWTSVQVRGAVETVSTNHDADLAFQAIADNPFPPEFGIDSKGQPRRSGAGSFLWMMRPRSITGRSSSSPVRTAR